MKLCQLLGMEYCLCWVCCTYILSSSIVVITVNAALLGVKLCVGVFLREKQKKLKTLYKSVKLFYIRKNCKHINRLNSYIFECVCPFFPIFTEILNMYLYTYMQATTCWCVHRAVKFATGHQASYFISLMKINKRIVEQKNMIESKAPKTLHKLLYTHRHTGIYYMYLWMCIYINCNCGTLCYANKRFCGLHCLTKFRFISITLRIYVNQF